MAAVSSGVCRLALHAPTLATRGRHLQRAGELRMAAAPADQRHLSRHRRILHQLGHGLALADPQDDLVGHRLIIRPPQLPVAKMARKPHRVLQRHREIRPLQLPAIQQLAMRPLRPAHQVPHRIPQPHPQQERLGPSLVEHRPRHRDPPLPPAPGPRRRQPPREVRVVLAPPVQRLPAGEIGEFLQPVQCPTGLDALKHACLHLGARIGKRKAAHLAELSASGIGTKHELRIFRSSPRAQSA
jgi:hypothetical protein